MSEQEIPFEESATVPETEYGIREQEESTIFPEYRDDEKLIPRQRPRRGNLRLALIPGVVMLAFLLLSYVAGYAFYAHTSFSSWHHDEHFYDHDHFPQQQFDQPNQPNQPNQPIQMGQLVQIPLGTMPRIIVHNLTGQVTVHGATTNDATIQISSNDPIDSSAVHYIVGSNNGTLSIDIDSIPGDSNASAINLTITIPNNAFLTVVAESSIELDHITGEMNLQSERGGINMSAITMQGQSFVQALDSIQFIGAIDGGSDQFTCTNGPVILYLPANSSFHLDLQAHGSQIRNTFGKTDVGSAPRANVIISTYNGSIQISPAPPN